MTKSIKSIALCSFNRKLLESAGVNLYTILFAFKDELVDRTLRYEDKLYCVTSVEFGNDQNIIANGYLVEASDS